jgi:hypothetical protein
VAGRLGGGAGRVSLETVRAAARGEAVINLQIAARLMQELRDGA